MTTFPAESINAVVSQFYGKDDKPGRRIGSGPILRDDILIGSVAGPQFPHENPKLLGP